MTTTKCPGCDQEFQDLQSFGAHKKHCTSRITAAARWFLENWKINAEKHANKRRRVDDDGEDIAQVEKEPDSQAATDEPQNMVLIICILYTVPFQVGH